MTLKELRELVASTTKFDSNQEVEVWLPGSSIRLEFNNGQFIRKGDKLMIEGNINPGSVLLVK